MSEDVAFRSIENYLTATFAGDKVNIAFLGGELMINRRLVYAASKYVVEQAEKKTLDPVFPLQPTEP